MSQSNTCMEPCENVGHEDVVAVALMDLAALCVAVEDSDTEGDWEALGDFVADALAVADAVAVAEAVAEAVRVAVLLAVAVRVAVAVFVAVPVPVSVRVLEGVGVTCSARPPAARARVALPPASRRERSAGHCSGCGISAGSAGRARAAKRRSSSARAISNRAEGRFKEKGRGRGGGALGVEWALQAEGASLMSCCATRADAQKYESIKKYLRCISSACLPVSRDSRECRCRAPGSAVGAGRELRRGRVKNLWVCKV